MGLSDIKMAIRSGRRGSKTSTVHSDDSQQGHPMLKSRKRALSVPLSHPARVGLTKRSLQKTFDQEECLLFQKLPYEIRLIIWELVLGGNHIHIFSWSKLGHQVCQTLRESSYGIRRACLFRMPVDGIARAVIHGAPQKLLPLLQSCRRIYSEAINVLYTHNIFHFRNLHYPIAGLSKRMMPHRWDVIRQVSLTWHFLSSKHDVGIAMVERDWDLSCEALASMAGLQKLSVGLITETDTIEKSIMFEILGPLENIRTNGSIDVYVSWVPNEDCIEAEKALLKNNTRVVLHHLSTSVKEAQNKSVRVRQDPGSLYRPTQVVSPT